MWKTDLFSSQGGAKGTDQLAEDLGRHLGIQVEVLIPPGVFKEPYHFSHVPSGVGPSQSASEKLNKRVPTNFYILHLIQRNYVYAFGLLGNNGKQAQGGTGWSVQLALDQCKKVFLFDIASQVWYHSEYHYNVQQGSLVVETKFNRLSGKPTLHQSSAVIGSRIIDADSQQEIKALFNRTFGLPDIDNWVSNIEQLRLEGKELDL